MLKHKLVDFIIEVNIAYSHFHTSFRCLFVCLQFMEAIDKELSEMKITLNARARTVAEEFMKSVSHIPSGNHGNQVYYCSIFSSTTE